MIYELTDTECEWDIKDVMKGSETSKAVVGFNYEDKIIWTHQNSISLQCNS